MTHNHSQFPGISFPVLTLLRPLTLLRFLWLGTSNPQTTPFFSSSAFSCLPFLWSPTAFYFQLLYHSLARNHISLVLLTSYHSYLAKHHLQLGARTQIAACIQIEKVTLLCRLAFNTVRTGPQTSASSLSILLGEEGYPYNVLVSAIWTSYYMCQGRML